VSHVPLGDPAAHPPLGVHAGIVLAVAHRQLIAMAPEEIGAFGAPDRHVLCDLEYVLGRDDSDLRL
jgi:UDP-N-acetyl-D-galactosamine dehydrogenase